jgi:hypothetical protein
LRPEQKLHPGQRGASDAERAVDVVRNSGADGDEISAI